MRAFEVDMMNADLLEQFRLMPPEYQDEIIAMQRKSDELAAKCAALEDKCERQRQKILEEHLPRWRRWLVMLSWRVYCKAMPRYL
jgi:hypothetical protein